MSKDIRKKKEEQTSKRRLLSLEELSRVTGGVNQARHQD